jgi:hypothetical protein
MNTPTQPNDGGPAFPVLRETENPNIPLFMASSGMTLRDWFAGQALASNNISEHNQIDWADRVAAQAYLIADAMLAARKNINTTAQ